MPTGTVKWFNNAKGYGFILSSDGVSDIFAHYSAITMDGYKTLKAGQEVNYELIEGEKGEAEAYMELLEAYQNLKSKKWVFVYKTE